MRRTAHPSGRGAAQAGGTSKKTESAGRIKNAGGEVAPSFPDDAASLLRVRLSKAFEATGARDAPNHVTFKTNL